MWRSNACQPLRDNGYKHVGPQRFVDSQHCLQDRDGYSTVRPLVITMDLWCKNERAKTLQREDEKAQRIQIVWLSNDQRQPMLDQLVHFLDLLTFYWLHICEASEWTIIPWKFKEKAFTFIICRFCNRCTFKKLQWFSATGAQLWALSSVPAQFCGISLSSVVLIFMSAKWQNDAPGWGFGLTRWQTALSQCLVYNHEMLHILALVGCVKAHRVKTSL